MNSTRLLAMAAALTVLVLGALTLAASADEPIEGGVVKLPEFVVSGNVILPKSKPWRYARIPGFEILSDLPDKKTDKLLHDFQVFQTLLAIVWNLGQTPPTGTIPLILCGTDGQFGVFRPAKAAANSPAMGSTSLFLNMKERSSIVLNLGTTDLNIATAKGIRTANFIRDIGSDQAVNGTMKADGNTGSVFGTGSGGTGRAANPSPSGLAIDPSQQLEREYVKLIFSREEPNAPAWSQEGMAQLLTGLKYDGWTIVLGKLEDADVGSTPDVATPDMKGEINAIHATAHPQLGSGVQISQAAAWASEQNLNRLVRQQQASGTGTDTSDFYSFLLHQPLIPLAQLFAVERGSATAENTLGSLWAKEAEAFVHMCLYGYDHRYQDAFIKFCARVETEPLSEALFQDCFKMSYKQMEKVLADYIRAPVYRFITFKLPKGAVPEPAPIALREATETEIGCLTSEALLLGGHGTEARLALLAAYVRGARDPRLLADLGVAEVAAGETAKARALLEASAISARNPYADLDLARLRYAEATGGQTDGKLSADQTAAVLDALAAARDAGPPQPQVYDLIAHTWAQSASDPSPEDLGVLDEGIALFPQDLDLLYTAAGLNLRAGSSEKVTALIAEGLKSSRDPATLARFQRLQSQAALSQ